MYLPSFHVGFEVKGFAAVKLTWGFQTVDSPHTLNDTSVPDQGTSSCKKDPRTCPRIQLGSDLALETAVLEAIRRWGEGKVKLGVVKLMVNWGVCL